MSTEFLPREAFADEQSYIAHRRHVAALQRAERLKKAQGPVQTRPMTPAERDAQRRRRVRTYSRQRYWRNVEAERAYHLSYYHRNRDKYGENARLRKREKYTRLKEADPLGYAVFLRDARDWYARNRDKQLAQKQEYYACNHNAILAKGRAKRAEKPGYISREDKLQRARTREAWIVMLRGQGLPWKLVAERVGSTAKSCESIYYKVMKRRGQQQANQQKRITKQHERDAFLLSSYQEGMKWTEYAKIIGYRSGPSASTQYYRALERATRPEQQDTQEQSA